MKVVIVTKVGCPYCESTKKLLTDKGLQYTDYPLNPRDANYNQMKQTIFNKYNWNTFPLIFINDKLVGGYSDLVSIL
jgi:glutaredoxin 3